MRTIIFEEKDKYLQLKKEVAGTCLAANNLIASYNRFGLTKVSNITDIENLINDPIDFFDSPMISKVTKIEGLEVNPEQLAKMYSIDRQAYLENVFGAKLIKSGVCVSCLPDAETLTDYSLNRRYEEYRDYLTFKNNYFSVDQSKIDQAKESYIVYADPDQETALQELQMFVDTCNRLYMAGILTTAILESMKLFSYSHDTHRLNIPFDKLQLLTKITDHERKTRADKIEN